MNGELLEGKLNMKRSKRGKKIFTSFNICERLILHLFSYKCQSYIGNTFIFNLKLILNAVSHENHIADV